MLYDYQEELCTKILNHLQGAQRCCASLATGGGKTFTFTELSKRLNGNTLILVNRVELVHQTIETFNALGVDPVSITRQVKNIEYGPYAVGMTQTIDSRFKKGKFDYNYYDNVIIDESHRLDYSTCLQHFTGKIIGFTATPIIEKSFAFTDEYGIKWTKKIPLAKYYHTLIEGVDINFLINNNFLVPEKPFISENYKGKGLKVDSKTGEFSTETVNKVYDKKEAFEELSLLFENHAKGQKTIIFNGTTKVNLRVYKGLKEKGYPVQMYDSMNNDEKDRERIVNWFRETPGAILCNVNVFTTGFDVKEVECIILNRATTSLSLYLQMVGRGGRITDKIYKPYFTFIDLGGNINQFGLWSAQRDWAHHFYNDEEKKVTESNPIPKSCKECGAFIEPKATICPECGAEMTKKEGPKLQTITGKDQVIQIRETPKPNTHSLIKYCQRNNLHLNTCRNLFYKGVAEMFERTPKSSFEAKTEIIKKNIKKTFEKDYALIQKSGLPGNYARKKETFFKSIFNEIQKYYETR